MGRFNTATKTRKAKGTPREGATVNLAGGEAFPESPRLELASLVLTSLLKDQFYRKADTALDRLSVLVAADPLFAAKAAVYARNEYGLRSISHAVAAEVAAHGSGSDWKRPFFRAVVRRPDDVTEILSRYHQRTGNGKKRPNAMVRGLADALARFDAYQVAKYRGEGRGWKLVDAANVTHPGPTDAIGALVRGEAKASETWEAKLSEAGQAESEEEVAEAKGAAWLDMLQRRKLGYFALLKNARNIAQQAPEAVPLACEQLVDEKAIRRSLVLPFRFITAARQLQAVPEAKPLLAAMSTAAEIALANVPDLPGRTVVVLDGSGSMQGDPMAAAAPFAVAIVRKLGADLVLFSTDAAYYTLPPEVGIFAGTALIESQCAFGGTDFHAPFRKFNRPYDRMIWISDMQGWVDFHAPTADLAAYRQRWEVQTRVFSFDVVGYGTLEWPEKDIYTMAGISDRVFEVMAKLEEDREALIHRIEAVSFDAAMLGERTIAQAPAEVDESTVETEPA